MKRIAVCRVVALGAFVALCAALPAAGQSNVKVVLSDVVDDRISDGMVSGGLVLIAEPRRGGARRSEVGPHAAEGGEGRLAGRASSTRRPAPRVQRPQQQRRKHPGRSRQPAAGARRRCRVSGTADLFVPGRDPSSVVKVPGFLARPGKPVASKGLKAAKVELTVLSKESYVEARKKNRLDEKKIAEIRAEAKERGMKDEEVGRPDRDGEGLRRNGGVGLPRARPLPARSRRRATRRSRSSGSRPPSGERIETGGSASRTDEEMVLQQIDVKKALPKDAVLVLSLFTEKAIVSVPFDIKEVRLP